MKSIISRVALLGLLCISACAPKTSVVWTEGETDPQTGKAVHTITIQNPPKDADWNIWCSSLRIRPTILEESNGSLQHISGSLHRIWATGEYTDQIVVKYAASPLARQSWAPEAFTLEVNGEKPVALKTEYVFQPVENVPDFPYTKQECKVEDMIPALKSVTPAEGTTGLKSLSYDEILAKYLKNDAVEGQVPGWYRITLDGDVSIEAADKDGAFWAAVSLSNICRSAAGAPVQNMVIEDWPDMPYRGLMLDVARNFTSKDNVLKLIDVMAHYKLNVLHLHLADDEGWRLELPGIPQLTEFSAFHSLPVLNEDGSITETEHLQPSYSGAFNPKDLNNTGNGFYTKSDFIEILKYAAANHIRVIAEMDCPGHGRAALKGMDYYCDVTGDESYRLTEPADESKYYSVQYYDDNAFNVALPGTYKFIEKFFDTLVEYYAEAGVELTDVHIGGDEVPGGAWMGSPACKALMEQNGWTSSHQLKAYFIDRVMDIAEARGVKIDGWQEVVQNLGDETFARIKKNLGFTNCWSSWAARGTDQLPYKFANQGINVVLSNMTNAYADFAYNYSKLERGHSWGGLVDERRSYSLLPYNIYNSVRWDDRGKIADISPAVTTEGKEQLNADAKCHIIGVQAQLWTETIRSFDHVTYYFFPKMLGLFERGWNASPAWESTTVSDDPAFTGAFDLFYSIVTSKEMPYYDKVGIAYRHRNE